MIEEVVKTVPGGRMSEEIKSSISKKKVVEAEAATWVKIADLISDKKMLTYARKFAKKILEDDKNLTKDKNNNLLNTYNHLVKNKDLWSYIG